MSIEKRRENDRLSAYDPFREMQTMIDRLFDEFPYSRARTLSKAEREFYPAIDILETEKEYEVQAELPGVEKGDIDIQINNRVLTIKGEKKCEKRSEEKGRRLFERTYGSFERSFSLPENADESQIGAKYENGILRLTIPKSPEIESKKKIEIK